MLKKRLSPLLAPGIYTELCESWTLPDQCSYCDLCEKVIVEESECILLCSAASHRRVSVVRWPGSM